MCDFSLTNLILFQSSVYWQRLWPSDSVKQNIMGEVCKRWADMYCTRLYYVLKGDSGRAVMCLCLNALIEIKCASKQHSGRCFCFKVDRSKVNDDKQTRHKLGLHIQSRLYKVEVDIQTKHLHDYSSLQTGTHSDKFTNTSYEFFFTRTK